MKDEIKEKIKAYYIANDIDEILDYITNLQEKSNNQAEEINRLYKQREKFMKKYGYLKEEKDKYKNVIDKIKEIANKTDYDKWELQMTSIEKLMKIQKILEEVDE